MYVPVSSPSTKREGRQWWKQCGFLALAQPDQNSGLQLGGPICEMGGTSWGQGELNREINSRSSAHWIWVSDVLIHCLTSPSLQGFGGTGKGSRGNERYFFHTAVLVPFFSAKTTRIQTLRPWRLPLQIESLHIILILYISTKYRRRNTSFILKNTHTSTEKGRGTRGKEVCTADQNREL